MQSISQQTNAVAQGRINSSGCLQLGGSELSELSSAVPKGVVCCHLGQAGKVSSAVASPQGPHGTVPSAICPSKRLRMGLAGASWVTQLSARCAALGRCSASKQLLIIWYKLQALWAWVSMYCLCTGSPLFPVLLEDIQKCALSPQGAAWETPALAKMGRSCFHWQIGCYSHISRPEGTIRARVLISCYTTDQHPKCHFREESSLDVKTSGDKLQHFSCILFQ